MVRASFQLPCRASTAGPFWAGFRTKVYLALSSMCVHGIACDTMSRCIANHLLEIVTCPCQASPASILWEPDSEQDLKDKRVHVEYLTSGCATDVCRQPSGASLENSLIDQESAHVRWSCAPIFGCRPRGRPAGIEGLAETLQRASCKKEIDRCLDHATSRTKVAWRQTVI